jgi:PAS domain S-box-containing protein
LSFSKLNVFERFLIGNKPELNSIGQFRRSILVAETCILVIFICGIYAAYDLYYRFFKTEEIYFSVFIITIIAFLLNRFNQHKISKIVLICTLIFSIYLFSSANIKDSGTYALFFPLLLLSFSFFDYHEFRFSIFFASFSILLFFTDYFTYFSIIPPVILPESFIFTMKAINFSTSLLTTLFLIAFLVRTSYISELSIIESQQQLKKLTSELQESAQRYELAMTGTNAGIWDWDLKNNKIYHGLRWKEILGYSLVDDMNISIDNFYPFVHPEDVTRVQESLKDHFEKKVPYNIEYRIRKKDNKYEWIYDAGKAIWNESGQPVRMVGSIINISKRKQDEQKITRQNEMLEKANAELDRFVYITSHDLKAPLLSILGLVNLAEMSENKVEIDLCLKMMRERVKGLEKFISDIIDYSRNVRVGLVKEVIDLNKIVTDIINEFLFMDNVNKVNFNISIDPDFTFVSDQKRISVILKNLISNAIKYHNYNQDNPQIIINGYSQGENIVISVYDNGDGIDPDIQPKIFDMFYRGTEKSNGSGLGLYIVKEMIEKLDGKISVNSNPNKGSNFVVTLPKIR